MHQHKWEEAKIKVERDSKLEIRPKDTDVPASRLE